MITRTIISPLDYDGHEIEFNKEHKEILLGTTEQFGQEDRIIYDCVNDTYRLELSEGEEIDDSKYPREGYIAPEAKFANDDKFDEHGVMKVTLRKFKKGELDG